MNIDLLLAPIPHAFGQCESHEDRILRLSAAKAAAQRERYYKKKRREEAERDARIHGKRPTPETVVPLTAAAPAGYQPIALHSTRLGASLGFPNYSRLTRLHDGNWALRQWRSMNTTHVSENPKLAEQLGKFRRETRS
eukprot:4544917-Pleurochrysis_carterae.AAC.1